MKMNCYENDRGYRVTVMNRDYSDMVDVAVWRRADDQTVEMLDAHGGVSATRKEGVPWGNDVKPTLTIQSHLAQKLVEAFMGLGIKPDAEARNEGELGATKYHLEDLRTLLKIREKP